MNAYAIAAAFLILAAIALFFVMFPAELSGWGDFGGFNEVYIPLIPLLAAIGAGFMVLSRRR